MRRASRAPIRTAVAALLLAIALVGLVAAPAAAHGGPIGLSVLANNPAGPLQSVLRVHAVWVNDGDDADGLSLSVQGSGPGSMTGSLSGASGVYQGMLIYPVGGTWTLTVTVTGAPYEYSATPLVVTTTVEGAPAPPPTAAPAPAPVPAPAPAAPTTPPATAAPTTETTTPSAPAPSQTDAIASGGPIVVVPDAVANGSYAIVRFAVPNPRADANVVKTELRFSALQPLIGAQTQPIPGWTSTTAKVELDRPNSNTTERVGSVEWSTTSTALAPGEFQLYTVSIGPMPKKAKSMWVDVVQTYDDGQTVAWDARPTKADPQPPHASARIRLVKTAKTSSAPGIH